MRQLRAQLLGLVTSGQASDLASDGLDLGSAIQPRHAAQVLRVMVFRNFIGR